MNRCVVAKAFGIIGGALLAVAGSLLVAELSAQEKKKKAAPDPAVTGSKPYDGKGNRPRAFPGAEGAGAYALGGRGGKVIQVTNLNDSGPGSFRAACQTEGPRTVVFRVGGIIALQSQLQITKPYLTIAGQTAPGDGICLKGDRFQINAHDVIVRHLRCRLGDETRKAEDAIATYTYGHDVILDHCSASWAVDETLSATHARNVTVQWCIISESLNKSVHPKGAHGYGSLINGEDISYHHNLYAHHSNRTPRPAECLLDFRNNTLYDYGGGGYNHGEKTRLNYVGNYIIPTRTRPTSFRIGGDATRVYYAGNYGPDFAEASADNSLFFEFRKGALKDLRVDQPFAIGAVHTDTAQKAHERVLQGAGATLPRRDAVDQRVVEQVRKRTGKIINSQTEVGGYPEYKSGKPYVDGDADGIADAWEIERGLNPNDAADGNRVPGVDGYTYLEHFLNGAEPKGK